MRGQKENGRNKGRDWNENEGSVEQTVMGWSHTENRKQKRVVEDEEEVQN